jgi:hypothetical protein
MKITTTMTLVLAGLAAQGCAPPAEEHEKVAEVEIANGLKLEILASSDGSFVATQSGPLGTAPLRIDEKLVKEGDPVALFKSLAPNHPVPATLIAANQRSVKLLKAQSKELEPQPSQPETLAPVPVPARADRVLALPTQSNWTGYSGCPAGYFTDQGFCPGNDAHNTCYFNVIWAFFEHGNALGGNGAVCADHGQLTFRITAGSVTEYTVDQGSWRTATVLHKRTCGWFTCSDVRNYTRFEIVNRPDQSVGHFGATLDY